MFQIPSVRFTTGKLPSNARRMFALSLRCSMRLAGWQMDRQIDRLKTDRQTKRQTEIQKDIHKNCSKTKRQKDINIDSKIESQTKRQTDRHIDVLADTPPRSLQGHLSLKRIIFFGGKKISKDSYRLARQKLKKSYFFI